MPEELKDDAEVGPETAKKPIVILGHSEESMLEEGPSHVLPKSAVKNQFVEKPAIDDKSPEK